ncbi:hypothetical protein [Streptomyces sp. NPDC046939]|uniref:hypothetical protein n=1 Tax=Streptomyces sp. NPDC046939 TaxID=3155376 RepID=UPI003408E71C
MTGIGPVESWDPGGDATDGGTASPARVDTLSTPRSETPRLRERWAAVPVRRRRATLLLVACAAALGVLPVLRPTPAATTPSPWPAQATTVRYDGPAPENGAFRFTLRVSTGSPVSVRQLRAGLPELGAATTPRLPLTVRPGEPRTVTVWLAVYACTGLPRGIDLPQLDMDLRNERARQRHSFLFGGAFARDLWAFLRANCGPALPRPALGPSASYGPPETITHVSNTQLPPAQ